MHFKQILEDKEMMNLTKKSTLHLEDGSVNLLKTAVDALMTDFDTYKSLRSEVSLLDNTLNVEGSFLDRDVLFFYEEEEYQFSKLRQLLQNLAQNKNNPNSLLLWNELINPTSYQPDVPKEQNPFQTRYQGLYIELFD